MADQKLTALTEDNSPDGSDLSYVVTGAANPRKRCWPDNNYLPEGFRQNGEIAVTVASNDITVALKTKSGGNPSTTDPVSVWLNGDMRRCTATLSVTKADATNWFGSGSAVTAAQEIDYFVYLIWNTTPGTDIMDIGFARIPNARVYSDFSATTTSDRYLASSNGSAPTSTDNVTVIGRFAATLSAAAGHVWTVPTFTNKNLIQFPIYETRQLTFIPAPTGYSAVPTDTVYQYNIKGDFCTVTVREVTNGTSNGTGLTMTAPITAATLTNMSWAGYGNGIDNGAALTTFVRTSIPTASTTITFNPNGSGSSTWTNVNGKRIASASLMYGI
jgi:hypothetical protein